MRIVAREQPVRLVLLGHPVAHSLSPRFQNAALEHAGIAARYESLDVTAEDLPATLALCAQQAAAGNVTIPHKEHVACVARCTPLAHRVGAVNTFWHDAGVLVGHNTDVAGVRVALEQLCPEDLSRRRVLILGAGGSAAATLVALDELGVRPPVIASRTMSRAEALVARLSVNARVVPSADAAAGDADLVINTTPVGLRDSLMPLAPAQLAAGAAVLDLVYRAHETAWVRACRAAGHVAVDGRTMLLEQGAAAFECWFDVPAPRAVMRAALANALGDALGDAPGDAPATAPADAHRDGADDGAAT